MCRLMAYFGPEILVAEVVLYPSRSIIKQSYDARERLNDDSLPLHLRYGNLNGDGFGIGWYPPSGGSCCRQDRTPCTFTSVTPAWNNLNLGRLARKLESGLIFAHVRAAYPGMPVSDQNCHPFAYGPYLFMHNGVVAGFLDIRRKLLAELSEEAFNSVESFSSDSAVCFAVFLDKLPNIVDTHSPEVLLRAAQETILTVTKIQEESGVSGLSLLNFVVSDGQTLIATRYVSNSSCQAASLYFSEGFEYGRARADDTVEAAKSAARAEAATAVVRAAGGGAGATGARAEAFTGEADYHLKYSGKGTRVCMIASEPVTSASDDWAEVPSNTAVVISRDPDGQLTVLRAPLDAHECCGGQQEAFRCLEASTLNSGGFAGPSRISTSKDSETDRQHQNLRFVNTPRLDGSDLRPLRLSRSQESLDSTAENSADSRDASALSAAHLTGHRGEVVAFAVFGEMLFSGALDATIKVWCLRQGKYVRTLRGHKSPIRILNVISSSRHNCSAILLSCGSKTIRMWRLDDFACFRAIRVGDSFGCVKAMVVSSSAKDVVYVGGQDCTVRAFRTSFEPRDGENVENNKEEVSPEDGASACQFMSSDPTNGHCGSITSLALAGEVLFSGGADSTIRAWDSSTLNHIRTMRGHRGAVLTLCVVSGLLLSAGRDRLIRVWDIETMVCRKTLAGHHGDVLQISALQDYSQAFLMGNSFCDGLERRCNKSPSNDALGFPPLDPGSPRMSMKSSVLFASCSADGALRVWDAKTFHCLYMLYSHPVSFELGAEVMSCSLTRCYAIAGMTDGTITLFEIEDAQRDRTDRQIQGSSPMKDKLISTQQENEVYEDRSKVLNREFVHALKVFTRIPTVSADPSKAEDSFRGAKFLLRLLDSLGAEVKLVQPVEGKNPVVIGRLGTDPMLPTVTCYAHYDVQPAMEPEWSSNPFEMQDIDGYFIGRGVSDNKGPLLAFVYAVKELLEESRIEPEGAGLGEDKCSLQDGMPESLRSLKDSFPGVENGRQGAARGLPVNVVFLFEGEEENGSIGFRQAVTQNLRWFEGTKVVLISNTLWVGESRPCLTYGMRGMLTMSVEVTGATRDLHSGNEGGVFSEPLSDLSKVLASLVDSRSNICVPGFYDDVRPDMLFPAMERLQNSSEFSLDGYRKALGVQELTAGRSEVELLTARWCQPSLSIVDVRVGMTDESSQDHYRFGPTRFSVIPRAAVGKISVRFVPNQDAKKLTERLTAHIHHEFAKLRSGNSISVKLHSMGDWWEAEPQSKLMRIAENAIERVWGETPLLVREGGTMPVSRALEKMLQAPALLVPMGQASDNCHLANERIRRVNLFRGKSVIKDIIQAVGDSF